MAGRLRTANDSFGRRFRSPDFWSRFGRTVFRATSDRLRIAAGRVFRHDLRQNTLDPITIARLGRGNQFIDLAQLGPRIEIRRGRPHAYDRRRRQTLPGVTQFFVKFLPRTNAHEGDVDIDEWPFSREI